MIVASVLLSLCLVGTDATVSDSVLAPLPVARLVQALQSNPEAVLRATGATVVWRHGDTTRVTKQAGRRLIDITVQEKIVQRGDLFDFSATLLRCDQGRVRAYRVQCRLQPYGNTATILWIGAYVDIDCPPSHQTEVREGLLHGIQSFKSYVLSIR